MREATISSALCKDVVCGLNIGKATRAPGWLLMEEPVSVLSNGGMIGDEADVESYTKRQKPLTYQ